MLRPSKDSRQMQKLQKRLAAPALRWVPAALVALIALVHLLDSYATDVCAKVQSLYVGEFFVRGDVPFETGLQKATLISTIGYSFMAIGPFYKALMDKVGRRPIFLINVAGMAAGMLLCFVSPNFYVFAAGQMCIMFFTMHDMQMIYVHEGAPPRWRSTLYFLCKFLGVFGTLTIPLLRDRFVRPDGSGWRGVFLLPSLVGLAIFLSAIPLLRESDVFARSRLAALQSKSSAPEKTKDKKSGIGSAFRYIFRQKQLKWLAVALPVTCCSMYALIFYYESFLSTVYATKEVTAALYAQPFTMAGLYLISGFLADSIGRKKTTVVFVFVTVAGFIGFLLLTRSGVSPVIPGLLLGCYIGGFWNITDLNGMMFAESSPTEIRGSVMGVQTILMGIGTAVSLILCMVLLSFMPLGAMMAAVGLPGVIAGGIVTLSKCKETKGTDLEKIAYEAPK
ncbi:MAG: MFS transporter [Clostridiales bacterium]|jgi:predicted MFS family arabinose efflux permease|nr:MFS transporter [Clostridiales bacterium]